MSYIYNNESEVHFFLTVSMIDEVTKFSLRLKFYFIMKFLRIIATKKKKHYSAIHKIIDFEQNVFIGCARRFQEVSSSRLGVNNPHPCVNSIDGHTKVLEICFVRVQ